MSAPWARREGGVGDEHQGVGVRQADRDAVGGRIGVEGQPRGAGLGDRDLGDEQVEAALHPQPRDAAAPEAAGREAARHGVGPAVDFGVGQARGRAAQAGLVRPLGGGAGEDLRQDLVADEFWTRRPFETRRDARRRGRGQALGMAARGVPLGRDRLAHGSLCPSSPTGPAGGPIPRIVGPGVAGAEPATAEGRGGSMVFRGAAEPCIAGATEARRLGLVRWIELSCGG